VPNPTVPDPAFAPLVREFGEPVYPARGSVARTADELELRAELEAKDGPCAVPGCWACAAELAARKGRS
jgi:hypothetical protein